jgi:hypothetical protein
MCTNGLNTDQFQMMLEQLDDQTALNRRWTHKMYHSATSAGFEKTATSLSQVQGLLDDVRALLTDTQSLLEKEADSPDNVTVNLV